MQLTRNEIIEQLKSILLAADDRNYDLIQNATEDSRLVEDFGFSSIGMLYTVIAIEETFGIRFDNVSVSDFGTLGDVVTYIEEKL